VADDEALRKVILDAIDEPIAQLGRDSQPSIRRTLRRAWWTTRNRVANLVFDRGLDTAETQYDAAHVHPDRVRYEPSGWTYLRRALAKHDVKPTDVFIDIGSGKGRVLLQAARYPFARVIGVEVSEELNRTARANLERKRARLACRDIEVVTADAAEYTMPDDATIAYLYYPFAGETLRRTLGHIVESLDRNPRRLTLIYACPVREEVIGETGRFRLERTIRGGRRDYVGQRIAVYVSEP
jgi:SAM-dependent methyltransferase